MKILNFETIFLQTWFPQVALIHLHNSIFNSLLPIAVLRQEKELAQISVYYLPTVTEKQLSFRTFTHFLSKFEFYKPSIWATSFIFQSLTFLRTCSKTAKFDLREIYIALLRWRTSYIFIRRLKPFFCTAYTSFLAYIFSDFAPILSFWTNYQWTVWKEITKLTHREHNTIHGQHYMETSVNSMSDRM